jgi:hypothetical protein
MRAAALSALSLLLLASLAPISAGAQLASAPPGTSSSTVSTAQPASDLAPVLGQLQLSSQAITLDLSRLRIESWKANSRQRQQARHDADSVSRNLTSALPAMIDQARNDPQSLAATFKLYRNVNAVYDVLSSIVESADRFASRSEYQTLAGDLSKLEGIRLVLGDRLQDMANARDTELRSLRAQVPNASAPAAPKKIVVDDEDKSKKPVKRKKPAASPPAPAPGNQGTTPSPQQ